MNGDNLGLTITEELSLKLLESYRSRVPENSYLENVELVERHGEYGLAFDNLCSDLEAANVKISEIEFEYFKRLARRMEYSGDFIAYYKKSLME